MFQKGHLLRLSLRQFYALTISEREKERVLRLKGGTGAWWRTLYLMCAKRSAAAKVQPRGGLSASRATNNTQRVKHKRLGRYYFTSFQGKLGDMDQKLTTIVAHWDCV